MVEGKVCSPGCAHWEASKGAPKPLSFTPCKPYKCCTRAPCSVWQKHMLKQGLGSEAVCKSRGRRGRLIEGGGGGEQDELTYVVHSLAADGRQAL